MYKICVFAGTTEGRELVSFLCRQNVRVFACVATQYGQTLLEERENLTVSAARLTTERMQALFLRERFDLVVDATHPYASAVTENIAEACASCATEYLRLLRGSSSHPEDCVFVENIAEAVTFLNGVEGNILLTTGSKELSGFMPVSDFVRRVYPRVLPMEQSLRLCDEAGVKKDHIIAIQGPFTEEMNAAMLRMTNAKYMVSKDTGKVGGFDEKIAAARQAGATLVVIGRPPQKEGLTYHEVLTLLCRRFGLTLRAQLAVLGIGPGNPHAMTGEVRSALARAKCVIGAKRMVEATAEPGQLRFLSIAPQEIADFVRKNPDKGPFAVVLSGDVGFFSGAKKLLPLLADCEVQLLPGLSSLAYLCARLGCSYEDVVCVSTHGREKSILPQVRRHSRVFALVGGENGAGRLCRELTEAGLSNARVAVGERLSYPDEAVICGTAAELAQKTFQSLSAVLIENGAASRCAPIGLPDDSFLRAERIPMTKSEVRAVCLSKLALSEDSIVWDIGAGTGSVSVEMALQATARQVYAVEHKEEALCVLRENCRRFGAENVTAVSGSAPEACTELPAPTHAFIGGSSGNMRRILALLLKKNPAVRIVATAIALETVAELTDCMKDFDTAEAVCMTVARGNSVGAYHLMSGQNPIYIFTLEGGRH